MKKIIFPLFVLILALAAAKFLFGVDIEGLSEGAIKFLSDILDGLSSYHSHHRDKP